MLLPPVPGRFSVARRGGQRLFVSHGFPGLLLPLRVPHKPGPMRLRVPGRFSVARRGGQRLFVSQVFPGLLLPLRVPLKPGPLMLRVVRCLPRCR
jgi:hypothetical protein